MVQAYLEYGYAQSEIASVLELHAGAVSRITNSLDNNMLEYKT